MVPQPRSLRRALSPLHPGRPDGVDGQVVATSLAVRPLWGGLLVNVLLYSLVAYVLVCLPGDVRRKKRDRGS